ncbi:MAG: hypothetical protein UY48_C0008G0008 [Candidatus Gottesmanbacteria bacterium GW2011_GWB1_49_7]|uniref:Uncharacterized protein n=1 Tax=Candidatus Gottesmanbacteria bacterium GW2011_GWB1_49_7 TaxID=1618448 RepID=A0A0G1W292_9BACT|nr:MAG: hypothetical protein UY48_C0008G0008 [Candidatus Gottesmanbacteria bacterium GW2011_GWB1_49_7]
MAFSRNNLQQIISRPTDITDAAYWMVQLAKDCLSLMDQLSQANDKIIDLGRELSELRYRRDNNP